MQTIVLMTIAFFAGIGVQHHRQISEYMKSPVKLFNRLEAAARYYTRTLW